MWIALVIIGLVLLAWLLLRSLSRRVPEQKYDPVPDLSVPQSEQWREIVHPVERNGKPVMLQTTRANQKPTIEPYIEDILVPQGTVDLRALDSRRLRVVGSAHYLEDDERIAAWTFELVREPINPHDANAIAVQLIDGRKVGHVSAVQPESYAPLLDRIG